MYKGKLIYQYDLPKCFYQNSYILLSALQYEYFLLPKINKIVWVLNLLILLVASKSNLIS